MFELIAPLAMLQMICTKNLLKGIYSSLLNTLSKIGCQSKHFLIIENRFDPNKGTKLSTKTKLWNDINRNRWKI